MTPSEIFMAAMMATTLTELDKLTHLVGCGSNGKVSNSKVVSALESACSCTAAAIIQHLNINATAFGHKRQSFDLRLHTAAELVPVKESSLQLNAFYAFLTQCQTLLEALVDDMISFKSQQASRHQSYPFATHGPTSSAAPPLRNAGQPAFCRYMVNGRCTRAAQGVLCNYIHENAPPGRPFNSTMGQQSRSHLSVASGSASVAPRPPLPNPNGK